MSKIMIVIPALNPNEDLITYVKELTANDFHSILVIDDGSQAAYKPIFKQLSTFPEVTLFEHAVNLGKGRALKNSFNYLLNLEQDYTGIITVDSDGQHRVSDVIKIRNAMEKNPEKIYFGSRNFNKENVPLKSSFGNKFTSFLFKLLYGEKIMDTQTGLRGLPTSCLAEFMDLKGERFEYETSMLISAVTARIEIEEIEIETVYFDNNKETHFKPLYDSVAIIGLLLGTFFKYMLSSLSSFIVDITLFTLFVSLFSSLNVGTRITVSTIIARIASSVFNYIVNKEVVFKSKESNNKTIYKYFSLVIVQLLTSAFLVTIIYKMTGVPEAFIKMIVDVFLFLISYRIQKKLIFK